MLLAVSYWCRWLVLYEYHEDLEYKGQKRFRVWIGSEGTVSAVLLSGSCGWTRSIDLVACLSGIDLRGYMTSFLGSMDTTIYCRGQAKERERDEDVF